MQKFNTNVELEEVDIELEDDDITIETQDIYKSLEYPCVVLRGITIVQELEYLSSLKFDTKSSLPLYVEFGGTARHLGKINLSIDGILALKSASTSAYELELCMNKDNRSKLDYLDIDTLEKLIRLD